MNDLWNELFKRFIFIALINVLLSLSLLAAAICVVVVVLRMLGVIQ